MLALEITPRDADQSVAALRKRGAIPAVFYGPKEEATSISIDARQLEHLWKRAGQTSVVTLKGAGEDKDALIHDAQFHPVTGKLMHVDFYVLEKGKKVKVKVPLEFEGAAPAEKAGHIVVKALHQVEIEVAPPPPPHSLPVALSKLANVGDHIVAKEIPLPASAALVTHADDIVVSVKEFKEEKEEITPAPETIIGETAKAEGEAEGAPAPAEKSEKSEKKEK